MFQESRTIHECMPLRGVRVASMISYVKDCVAHKTSSTSVSHTSDNELRKSYLLMHDAMARASHFSLCRSLFRPSYGFATCHQSGVHGSLQTKHLASA